MGQSVGDKVIQGSDATAVGEGTHRGAGFEAVAHYLLFHEGARVFKVLLVAFDEEARRRGADLASVAQFDGHRELHRAPDVGIFRDNHWRVAAQLHGGKCQGLSCQSSEMTSHQSRSGEGDLADQR